MSAATKSGHQKFAHAPTFSTPSTKSGLCHLLNYELEGITHSYFAWMALARAFIFAALAPRLVSRSRTA